MRNVDVGEETRIGRHWPSSLLLAAIFLGLVAICLYGIQIEPVGRIQRDFHRSSFVFLPAFLIFAGFVIYRLIVPLGAPVRVGPAGFLDLRAGRQVIPWDKITNVVVSGEFVTLTLRRGHAQSYPFTLTQRLLKWRRKSAGPGHLVIVAWCLATTPRELHDIIAAYRAA